MVTMDHAEAVAKRLLETALPGSRMSFRADQNQGQHDFDLYHPDGGVFSVEVTSSVDQELEETYAAVLNPKKGGCMVKTRRCKKDWHVNPVSGANINRIRLDIDKCLADVEADGLERFRGPTDWDHPSVDRLYRDLGVISGSVFPYWNVPGQIGIALPCDGGAFDVRAAVEAAEREAYKSDNIKKLRASGTNQRHLAVYVGMTNSAPWCALVDFDPPAVLPNCPPEITDLWLFSETGSESEYVVWRASTTVPWRRWRILLT